jgi:hypothetical protein
MEARMNVLQRLNAAASLNKSRKEIWLDRLSPELQSFVVEAAQLYLSGKTPFRYISDLHRSLSDIVQEDYTEDVNEWPGESAFVKWIQAKDLKLPLKAKPPKQPVNTKKSTQRQPKTASNSTSSRSTASKRQSKPLRKRA